ncbi:hypothetical protein DEHRE_11605 [Dehalobacter restrictus DSM 9455]|uniref:Uncharacterized protein n=1 Tax=Dehalobacter restrictus (strain DSM 9455 / PER-K23) TaxID=871738 RepID=A0ABM5PA59_DEHRP|nr:hypothetical protein DEHRE_11605 [Dehalobacter restrictus DSM 9455]
MKNNYKTYNVGIIYVIFCINKQLFKEEEIKV